MNILVRPTNVLGGSDVIKQPSISIEFVVSRSFASCTTHRGIVFRQTLWRHLTPSNCRFPFEYFKSLQPQQWNGRGVSPAYTDANQRQVQKATIIPKYQLDDPIVFKADSTRLGCWPERDRSVKVAVVRALTGQLNLVSWCSPFELRPTPPGKLWMTRFEQRSSRADTFDCRSLQVHAHADLFTFLFCSTGNWQATLVLCKL